MDKVPRKKEKKRIGRNTILLILLCCMAAAGAGAYFLNRPAPVPPLVGGEEKTLLLSRPAEEITVAEVLHSAEGSLAAVSCLEASCDRAEHCLTLPLWKHLDTIMDDYLTGVTLQDVLDGNV